MSKLTGGQHIGNVLTTPLGATVRGQRTPMATAAHTTRYDLQADMVADIMARRLLHSVLTMTAAHTGIIQN